MSFCYFLNKKNNLVNNKRGFTLIELLVVISIIALLSTVVLASLQNARSKARWAKFDSDLVQIRNAVALYRTNHNGDWPDMTSTTTLLTSLKNDGVYPKGALEYPDSDLRVYVRRGGLANPSGNYSCGQPDYTNVEYLIIFYKNDGSEKIDNTRALDVYSNGQSWKIDFDMYGYCIEL